MSLFLLCEILSFLRHISHMGFDLLVGYVMTLRRLSVCLSVHPSVTNFKIGTISDTIYSRVMKVGQKVACGVIFKMIWPQVTVIEGQSLRIYWKLGKYQFLAILDNISDTFHSRVIKHGPKVAWGETFKTMWHWVTLTEGHNLYLKVRKCRFLTIFDNPSNTIYW